MAGVVVFRVKRGFTFRFVGTSIRMRGVIPLWTDYREMGFLLFSFISLNNKGVIIIES